MGSHVDIGAYEFEPAQSDPFTVTKTGDTNDGLCGVVDCSLREAIGSGDSGDSVTIPKGVYTLTQGTELTIATSLTLSGAGSGDTIIQAAEGPGVANARVLRITAGSVNISSVTIRYGALVSGKTPERVTVAVGAGILLGNANLTLKTSHVTNNQAAPFVFPGGHVVSQGGGIWTSRSTLDVIDSTISGNFADNGGGITSNTDSLIRLSRSTVTGNTGFIGGGILNFASVAMTNSTINDNGAKFHGGISNGKNGRLTVTRSTISDNASSGDGGGIWNEGTGDLVDAIVSGNTADGDGGGILNGGTLTITSSTINENVARSRGGGIFNVGELTIIGSRINNNGTSVNGGGIFNAGRGIILGFGSDSGGTVAIADTVISGNTASNGGGGIFNTPIGAGPSGGTVTLTNSTISANSTETYGGGIFNNDNLILTNTYPMRVIRGAIPAVQRCVVRVMFLWPYRQGGVLQGTEAEAAPIKGPPISR